MGLMIKGGYGGLDAGKTDYFREHRQPNFAVRALV